MTSEPRPIYWSIWRELWENRYLYIAPLIVAGVVLFATFISVTVLPRRIRAVPVNDPARLHQVIVTPFSMAPAPVMLTAFLIGLFYSLDALYGERRDRSILFWKSLPVSDRTTVLSKAAIPLIVLPVIAIAIGGITQLMLLMLGSMVLEGSGIGAMTLWSEFRFIQEPIIMVYGVFAFALWWAPIYCWLILVSAWARRTPILWAVLPFMAIAAVERILFNTSYFLLMLEYRASGAMKEAFAGFSTKRGSHAVIDQFSQLDPVRFLTSSGLWVGLIFAAACLAIVIRLRRYREPI
jgi:ABC-2 type transport system permease protein